MTNSVSMSVLRPIAPRSPAELRKRCYARLAERFDPVRLRHKPLSLVRADARRQAEQALDVDSPTMPRTDRDRLADDVLAMLPGVGPLEELFRDDAVGEILVLGPSLVVAFKGGEWVPTTARYRDVDQVRLVVGRYAEAGVPLQPASPAAGVVDVRLATGFRVVAVLPPEVMGVCPTLHLTRGPAVAGGAFPVRSGSDVLTTPAPRGDSRGGSSVLPLTARPAASGSGVISLAATLAPTSGGSLSSASGRLTSASGANDPFAKLRQRMTENIILRLASAGVYDLNQVPLPELSKFITLAVGEYCQQEGMAPDPDFQQRLGLEILAGMNR